MQTINMHETFLIVLVKKRLWEFVATAICLSMVHSALENWGGKSQWVTVTKGIVNGIYASIFFGGLGGYYMGEVGLVGGIVVGGVVGLSTVKEVAAVLIEKFIKK